MVEIHTRSCPGLYLRTAKYYPRVQCVSSLFYKMNAGLTKSAIVIYNKR